MLSRFPLPPYSLSVMYAGVYVDRHGVLLTRVYVWSPEVMSGVFLHCFPLPRSTLLSPHPQGWVTVSWTPLCPACMGVLKL